MFDFRHVSWRHTCLVIAIGSLVFGAGCEDLEENSPRASTSDAGLDTVAPEAGIDAPWESSIDSAPVCSDGDFREIDCGDGGTQRQVCENGAWENDGACVVLPTCLNEGQQRLAPCDNGSEGQQPEICRDNHWHPMNIGCIRSWQWDGSDTDIARSVAVDQEGNALIAGLTMGEVGDNTSAGNTDSFVIKLSPEGKVQWITQWGSDKADAASAIALDSNGNAYVVGYTDGDLGEEHNQGQSDGFLTKISSDGTVQWTHLLGTPETDGAIDASPGPDGTILVTGYTFGAMFGQQPLGKQDMFLAAFRPDGSAAWSTLWGTKNNDNGTAVTTGPDGSITLVGVTMGTLPDSVSHGNLDFAVVGFDSQGKVTHEALFGSIPDDTALAVAATSDPGHVFIAGFTYGALPGTQNLGDLDAFVTGVYLNDSSGPKLEHTQQFGTDNFDLGKGVVVTDKGEVFSCGDTYGQLKGGVKGGQFDIFLARNSPGIRQAIMLGSPGDDQCHGLAVSGRTIWLAGHAGGHLPTSPQGQFGAIAVARVTLR